MSTLMGFHAIEGVEVAALCDLDEELLRQKSQEHGIPHTYRVFDDMLESDIDAVVIATPMQCHVPQAIAALAEAGKHVLSEVTAGVTMDELWWLKESVEKSGKNLHVCGKLLLYALLPANSRNDAARSGRRSVFWRRRIPAHMCAASLPIPTAKVLGANTGNWANAVRSILPTRSAR